MGASGSGSSIRQWLWYGLALLVMPLVFARLGLDGRQTIAVAGFCVVLFGAIIFWEYRLAFACFGTALLLATGLLDVPHLIEFAGLDIILFLIAMMTIIGFMEERLFFEFLIEKMLHVVGPHPRRIMVVMMIMATVSAALVDEVTSILFMTTAMLNLLGRSGLNPLPYMLMLIFTTNIGSSATAVGNPVGVIIALRSGLTFTDFLRWASPISIVCLAATIPICLRLFKKDINKLKGVLTGRRGAAHIEDVVAEKDERAARAGVAQSGWLFAGVVGGLVLHHPMEHVLGLPGNTMLLGVALLGAGIALAMSGHEARVLVEKRVDWWTLAFFLLLFSSVGTLKYSGVTSVLATRLIELSGGNIAVLTGLFGWSAWVLTAVMDNVLAVATFVPIVSDVAQTGLNTFPLWWAMLMGGTLGGNATLIGSTANIVAVGLLERRKMGTITFGQWLKPGMTVAIITMLIATALLFAQLSLMPEMAGSPPPPASAAH
jgi:Na+/H+ antiporter NhaD/arsenite permease-like protein